MPIAITTPTPKCHGYILTSQHPAFSHTGDHADPYAVIPCPFEAATPPHLGTTCGGPPSEGKKGKKGKNGCAKGQHCERHWCGKCKVAREEAEAVQGGLTHGFSPVREAFKVELKEVWKREPSDGAVGVSTQTEVG